MTLRLVTQQADTNKSENKKEDVLDVEEFMEFYKLITHREEIQSLFDMLVLALDDLTTFINYIGGTRC